MDGDTDSIMDEEQPPQERKERHTKCFHLFNCDQTYKLDAVEKLLNRVNAIKDKLRFDISIATSKYFALFEMIELCKTIQSEPPMDFAIFVVHAHESRLSINEDNAGIGYARFYRALLEKTGERFQGELCYLTYKFIYDNPFLFYHTQRRKRKHWSGKYSIRTFYGVIARKSSNEIVVSQ